MVLEMIEIFRRPQHHTKANIQYNFIIQKTFKVCILSCQRASVPFSTGPGGKELNCYNSMICTFVSYNIQ